MLVVVVHEAVKYFFSLETQHESQLDLDTISDTASMDFALEQQHNTPQQQEFLRRHRATALSRSKEDELFSAESTFMLTTRI